MALDAATLALTAGELKQTLTDAKIAKIFEPTRDELVLTLRTRTETYALLLSARSGSARVCLTEESFENPETPPSFCMLMRKHLTGGRLLDVHMEPGDRIVYFDFQCTNEMGDLVRNTLCAELMGRYSNLVLVQNGKIIDALKRVDFEDSDVRQLLPGLPYTTPPKPARPDFLLVSAASIVSAACERDLPVADALNKTVAGVGPVVCREAAWRAFHGEHLMASELDNAQKARLMAAIDGLKEIHEKGGEACRVTAPDGKPVEYTFFRPQQYSTDYAVREWVRTDSQQKLKRFLAEEAFRTEILTDKIKTTDREDWVQKKLAAGMQVLIVNPSLVETGLDLNAFTTLVFYSMGYKLFTLRQASRRSWRINQKAPAVKVYMLYYEDTMQQKCLKLMASKLAVAGLIEGNFSEEGLAAMSDVQDMTSQMAKELMLGIRDNVEDIAAAFRKMAFENPDREVPEVPAEETSLPPETVPAMIERPKRVPTAEQEEKLQAAMVQLEQQKAKRTKKTQQVENQLSLFDSVA